MNNLFKGELLKLKNSSIFKVSILSSFIIPFFISLIMLKFGLNNGSNPMLFEDLFNESISYITIIFGLIINIIMISYLFIFEIQEHTLKLIIQNGVSKTKLFLVKLLTFIIWSLFNISLTWILILIIGLIFNINGLTGSLIYTSYLNHILAQLLLSLIAIPFILISLIFKNLIASVIGGLAVTLGSFMILNDKLAALYPTTGIYLFITKQFGNGLYSSYNLGSMFLVIFTIFIVGLLSSYIYYIKTDVSL